MKTKAMDVVEALWTFNPSEEFTFSAFARLFSVPNRKASFTKVRMDGKRWEEGPAFHEMIMI